MTHSLFTIDDMIRSQKQIKRCKAAMDRYRDNWAIQKTRSIPDWNVGMELAGRSYCMALVEFNRVAQIVHANQPKALSVQAEALEALDLLLTEFEDLFATKEEEINVGWRRDIMHHIMGHANAAITDIKMSSQPQFRTKPRVIKLG